MIVNLSENLLIFSEEILRPSENFTSLLLLSPFRLFPYRPHYPINPAWKLKLSGVNFPLEKNRTLRKITIASLIQSLISYKSYESFFLNHFLINFNYVILSNRYFQKIRKNALRQMKYRDSKNHTPLSLSLYSCLIT